MDENSTGLSVFYVEDIMRKYKCSAYTARKMMKETGHVITIGRKQAVPIIAFIYYINGQNYTGIEISKPVDGLHVG